MLPMRVVMTEIEILEEKSLRRIVVGIHHDRAEMNFVRAVGDVVSHSRSRKHGGEEQAGSNRGHNFHASENTLKPFRELRTKEMGVASSVAAQLGRPAGFELDGPANVVLKSCRSDSEAIISKPPTPLFSRNCRFYRS